MKKVNWITWQNVPEIGKLIQGKVYTCGCCVTLVSGDIIVVDSSNFAYCSCGRYANLGEEITQKEVIAVVTQIDKCDCNKIAHNDGGNYHYAKLKV